ncbi:MAG TPA: alpha/beta fold hydrolase [Candidatus Caccosoma faecigallinarum]|uniref:Alpha/beta fold hydrolase n=1 Tax=Candidatus Caccosoma faecigallinarum TaxID=2840720 RepID=A0A9D1KAQ3_9FIRM|nr:alpha/beta fold hydrolase [Candidatus Caccosoma faecigallinarum]
MSVKKNISQNCEKGLLDKDWVVKNFSKEEANNLKTIVIAVHGFSSSRNSFVYAKIAPTLRENNIGMVCFDLPGHGLRKNLKLNVKACLDTIKDIEDELRSFYSGPISLTGASFGGFLLLRYLENNKRIYGKVILRAPALEEYDVCKYDTLENWKEMIECLDSGKNYFRDNMEVETSMLEDYFKFDIFNHLNIKEDVKLIYCSEDISINNNNIFKLAKLKNWQLFEIKGADHFCRREQDIKRITSLFLDIL